MAPIAFERVSSVLETPGTPLVDPEELLLPRRGYDLIVSIFDLQIVNDVPGFLARVRAHLAADGLFLAAAIGGDSLLELRAGLPERRQRGQRRRFCARRAVHSAGRWRRTAAACRLRPAGGRRRAAPRALSLAAGADGRAEGPGGVQPAGGPAGKAGDADVCWRRPPPPMRLQRATPMVAFAPRWKSSG